LRRPLVFDIAICDIKTARICDCPAAFEIAICDLKLGLGVRMRAKNSALVMKNIESLILEIRGHKVMLDSSLADLYGVSTKRLNQQMKRNLRRFPSDFMFQLTGHEFESLRSQFATSKAGRGGRRFPPYAFTEHGTIMLASVLNTERAIEASIYVVRAFVRMRELIGMQKAVAHKLTELERRIGGHDEDIRNIVAAIRQLMAPPQAKKKRIGFDRT
jgi:hypothetical protein